MGVLHLEVEPKPDLAPLANLPPVISDTVPPMMAEAAVPYTSPMLLTYGDARAVTPALTKPCPNLPPWITLATPPLLAAIAIRLVERRFPP